jgi:hypothetical protein
MSMLRDLLCRGCIEKPPHAQFGRGKAPYPVIAMRTFKYDSKDILAGALPPEAGSSLAPRAILLVSQVLSRLSMDKSS